MSIFAELLVRICTVRIRGARSTITSALRGMPALQSGQGAEEIMRQALAEMPPHRLRIALAVLASGRGRRSHALTLMRLGASRQSNDVSGEYAVDGSLVAPELGGVNVSLRKFNRDACQPTPVRLKVVTHVLGTFCYLCVRAGQMSDLRHR